MEQFSLPWQEVPGGWDAGDYTIRFHANGTSGDLRYRGTLIHNGFTADDCKIEADRHRGINRPAWRP